MQNAWLLGSASAEVAVAHLDSQRELLHKLTAEYTAADHMQAASANINFINHEVAIQQKRWYRTYYVSNAGVGGNAYVMLLADEIRTNGVRQA